MQEHFDVINYVTVHWMTCGFDRPDSRRHCRSALEWGKPYSKFSFGEVYRRIYVRKSRFTAPLARRRKTKFPTVYPTRYIVGYTFGNHVSRLRSRVAVKLNFRPYIRRYTFPNENFEYSYPLNVICLIRLGLIYVLVMRYTKNGFTVPYRRNHPGDNHGGICVKAKKSIYSHHTFKPDLEVNEVECLRIEIYSEHRAILLETSYRQPNSIPPCFYVFNS